MNYSFILIAAFTIFVGCSSKLHTKRQFASINANAKNKFNTSTNEENTTTFPNIKNKSFEILQTDIKQPEISNENEYNRSRIIVSVPKDEEEKKVFPIWQLNLIDKMKYLLISFFNKIEQEQTDLTGIDNKFDSSTNSKLKPEGFDDIFKKAKNALTGTTKTALETTKNVVENAGEKVKKVTSRNTSFYNATGNSVADEGDLTTAKHICHQHCKDGHHASENNTALAVVADNTNADINGYENSSFKTDKHTTAIETKSTHDSNSSITEASQLIKQETEIISVLEEQTEPRKIIAVVNESTVSHEHEVNNNKNKLEKRSVIDEDIQIKNVLEEKITPTLVNTTKMHLKPIDKNTEYFFGEVSAEQTTATPNIENKIDKNASIDGNTAESVKERYRKIHPSGTRKCKGNCIHSKTIQKRSAEQNNALNYYNNSGGISQNIIEIFPFTWRSYNTSNQNATNNTSGASVHPKSSKNIDRVKLKADGPEDVFMDKDWLWRHLQAVKNSSFKTNPKENFLKTHHFLSNSGGTENSTTAASEFSRVFFYNISDETDLTIELNKMILENEHLHQIPHVQKDLPLKRYRRIRRYASRISEPNFDQVETLPDDNENLTTNLGVIENETTFNNSIPLDIVKNRKVEQPSSAETTAHPTTSGKSDFGKEETEIKVTVPQTTKGTGTSILPKYRSHFETELNDATGIQTKPLLLLVTVPSFIGMGVFILALCFVTRNGGWCCRLFNAQSTTQMPISSDVQEPVVTNRTKYYR